MSMSTLIRFRTPSVTSRIEAMAKDNPTIVAEVENKSLAPRSSGDKLFANARPQTITAVAIAAFRAGCDLNSCIELQYLHIDSEPRPLY